MLAPGGRIVRCLRTGEPLDRAFAELLRVFGELAFDAVGQKGREGRAVPESLFAPEARAAYARLITQGCSVAILQLRPTEPIYTFWKYCRWRVRTRCGSADRSPTPQSGSE